MTRANAKWIRLMAVIGCTTMWMASCKHAPDAQMKASYATMKVSTANKELTTPYSATIRGRQDIDIYPQVSGTIERPVSYTHLLPGQKILDANAPATTNGPHSRPSCLPA